MLSEAESEIYVREEGTALLIHPNYQGRVTSEWFDHRYWGSQASLVDSGGRGGAWFIDEAAGPLVLREYRRGGLVARLSESSYIFLGERRTRSFVEFRLLNHLAVAGLPVPVPVAAMCRRVSAMRYQASILIQKIEGTQPLANLIGLLDPGAWKALGGVIRRFHDAGVYHADLNCFNVLVRNTDFYLIDFDKGRLAPGSDDRAKWKQTNLNRLHRSLTRLDWSATKTSLEDSWAMLLAGYNNG